MSNSALYPGQGERSPWQFAVSLLMSFEAECSEMLLALVSLMLRLRNTNADP